MNDDYYRLLERAKNGEFDRGRETRVAMGKLRQAVLLNYDNSCAKCGRPDGKNLEINHCKTWQLGGRTDFDNLIPLCSSCHRDAPDKDNGLAEYLAIPYTPKAFLILSGWITGLDIASEMTPEELAELRYIGADVYFDKYLEDRTAQAKRNSWQIT